MMPTEEKKDKEKTQTKEQVNMDRNLKQEVKKEEKIQKETPESPVKEEDFKKKYETASREAKENYNKWLYLYADFENYKKRILKEKADLLKYGNEVLVKELLAVIDALETALTHTKDFNAVKGLEEGIKLTLKQFLGVLGKAGVTPILSIGKKFDPYFHEVVGEEEKEECEIGTIIQEIKKGYSLHDRTLRAAHVIVAKKKGQKQGG